MIAQLELKSVYGEDKIYPLCDKARQFASIAGTKTLTKGVLRSMINLGYTLELFIKGFKVDTLNLDNCESLLKKLRD